MTPVPGIADPPSTWAEAPEPEVRPRALVVGVFPPEPGKGAAMAAQTVLVLAASGYEVLTIAVSGQGNAHRVLDFQKWHDLKRLQEELQDQSFDVVVVDPAAFHIRQPRTYRHLPVSLHQYRVLWRLAKIGRNLMTVRGQVGGPWPFCRIGEILLQHRSTAVLAPRLMLSKHRARLRRLLRKVGTPRRATATLAVEAASVASVAAPRRAATVLTDAVRHMALRAVPVGDLGGVPDLHDKTHDQPRRRRIDAAMRQDPTWSRPKLPVTRLMVHVRAALRALRGVTGGTDQAAKRLANWYRMTGRRSAGGGLILPSGEPVHGGVPMREAEAARSLRQWWTDLTAVQGFSAPLAVVSSAAPTGGQGLAQTLDRVVHALCHGLPLPEISPAEARLLKDPVVEIEGALSGLEFLLALITGRFDQEPKGSGWRDPGARRLLARLAAERRDLKPYMTVGIGDRPGVELIGFAFGGSGLAANLAMSARALRKMAVEPVMRGIDVGLASISAPEMAFIQPSPQAVAPARLTAPVRIVHLNADLVPQALCQPVLRDAPEAMNIGFLLWEFSTLPEAHMLSLDMLDEVWCPSEFVANAYRETGKLPVHSVRKSVSLGPVDRVERDAFGLPAGAFLFLVVFDFHSSVERKNPMAAVRAFRAAFPKSRRDVGLVIKTTEVVRGHWGDPRDQWSKVAAAEAADPRITIITGKMPTPRYMGLIAACDCLVSPHRAEGFGYAPAQALLLERPVIVTDYSGTQDFCTPETARVVAWSPRDVGPREAIYPVEGAIWADIDHDDLVAAMREAVKAPETGRARAQAGRALMEEVYSCDAQARRYRDRFEALGLLRDG